MTIHFTCAGCGSLLKIKDDLAGTDGKCPKCKTAFVVPSPEDENESRGIEFANPDAPKADSHKTESHKSESHKVSPPRSSPSESEKAQEKHPKPSEKAKKPAKGSDDFDPADFLMEDDNGGRRKPQAVLPSLDEESERHGGGMDSRSKRPAAKSGSGSSSGSLPSPRSDSVSASAHAKEMMMKAMEESRTHAADAPAEDGEAGFDYAGMIRELGVKGFGAIAGIILLAFGVYIAVDHLMGAGLALPPLGYVKGTVTLDGKPLSGAIIYFEPRDAKIKDGKHDHAARTSMGKTDDKGHFTMFYIDTTQGVALGKARVWLSLVGEKGQQVIPPDHTEGVLQIKEIKPGNQTIDFPLVTPPELAQPN